MSASPSAVVFNRRLYVFHHGGYSNKEIRYNVLDGNNWEGDKRVPKTALLDGPTPVVIGGNIAVYNQGTDNWLLYNNFDGMK